MKKSRMRKLKAIEQKYQQVMKAMREEMDDKFKGQMLRVFSNYTALMH
jgi:hypothetical protein